MKTEGYMAKKDSMRPGLLNYIETSISWEFLDHKFVG